MCLTTVLPSVFSTIVVVVLSTGGVFLGSGLFLGAATGLGSLVGSGAGVAISTTLSS